MVPLSSGEGTRQRGSVPLQADVLVFAGWACDEKDRIERLCVLCALAEPNYVSDA